jgi:hypothetical protein
MATTGSSCFWLAMFVNRSRRNEHSL